MRKTYEEALKSLLEKQELEKCTLETEYLVNDLLPIEPTSIFIPQSLSEKAWVKYVASTKEDMLTIIKSFETKIVPVVYASDGCFTIHPRNLLKDGYQIDERSESNFYIQSEVNRYIDNRTRNSLLFYVLIDDSYFRIGIELKFSSIQFSIKPNKGIDLPPRLKSENRRIPFGSGDFKTQSCYFMIADLEEFFSQDF